MAKNKPSNKPSKSGPSKASASKGTETSSVETPTGNAPDIDIGISGGDRKKIAEGLARFLSDSFTLYLKTHNFHWNVTG
jgi:starvation-inducible DNA-binding protein